MVRLALVCLGNLHLVERDLLVLAVNGDDQVALAVGLDVSDRPVGGVDDTFYLRVVLANQRVLTVAQVLNRHHIVVVGVEGDLLTVRRGDGDGVVRLTLIGLSDRGVGQVDLILVAIVADDRDGTITVVDDVLDTVGVVDLEGELLLIVARDGDGIALALDLVNVDVGRTSSCPCGVSEFRVTGHNDGELILVSAVGHVEFVEIKGLGGTCRETFAAEINELFSFAVRSSDALGVLHGCGGGTDVAVVLQINRELSLAILYLLSGIDVISFLSIDFRGHGDITLDVIGGTVARE